MISLRRFQTEEVCVECPGLPGAGAHVTFALVCDVHLRRWGTQHDRLLALVEERGVDFVFLVGDAIDRHRRGMQCLERLIRGLRARHGVFVVRGNYEVAYAPPPRRLRPLLEQWGARLLLNEARLVPTAAGPVCVAGLDDPRHGWPDTAAVLAAARAPACLRILLSHAPVAAALLPPGHSFDLVLAGHTHGGQVRVPLWKRAPFRFYGGWTDGLYRVGPAQLYVSRGFGAVGRFPLRLGCPAELAFFLIHGPPEGKERQ